MLPWLPSLVLGRSTGCMVKGGRVLAPDGLRSIVPVTTTRHANLASRHSNILRDPSHTPCLGLYSSNSYFLPILTGWS